MRDDVLHFGWMLRRRTNENRSVLAALGPAHLGLEIKMILAANREFAFELARRIGKRALKMAALNVVRFRMKTFLVDRVLNCENWRKRFVLDYDFLRSGATHFLRFANNERHDLAVIRNLLVGE